MADLSVTAANVLAAANATKKTGVAGAAITAGDSLYADSTDGNKLKPALHSGTEEQAECVGVALNDAADEQPAHYLSEGDLNPGATVAVGTAYAVGAAAGGIAPIVDVGTGDFMTIIGIATTTSNLKLRLAVGGVAKP